jgi:hypothetical protein
VENEEMGDSTVTAALEAAAKRGVDVTVVMTADSEWNTAFAALRRAGDARRPRSGDERVRGARCREMFTV